MSPDAPRRPLLPAPAVALAAAPTRPPRSAALGAYLALSRLVAPPPQAPERGPRGDGGGEGGRPPGPLLWVHADEPRRLPALAALAARLEGGADGAATLATLPPERLAAAADHLGELKGLLVRPAPPEHAGAVRAFLDAWQPDVLLWVGGRLRPALVAGGAPVRLLLEGAPERGLLSEGTWMPGLSRAVVPLFERALVTGAEAAARLARAGLDPGRIEIAPPLDAPPPLIPCNERERRDLAETIGGRPVWLAADLPLSELGAVAGAHVRASRGAHRLLLIVAPRDGSEGAAFAHGLAEAGLRVASREAGAEPDEEAQVYLADGPAEMGLWYRLAPLTYLGGTLPGGPGGRHPFEAAALGSALLHGPRTAPHEAAWARLHGAGGARTVRNGHELGQAVESLLAPDRAAAMAHAAWDVATEGSEVAGRVEALVREGLARRAEPNQAPARPAEAPA